MAPYVGKIREVVPITLAGGSLGKNTLFVVISIVPEDQMAKLGISANQIAVDESTVDFSN